MSRVFAASAELTSRTDFLERDLELLKGLVGNSQGSAQILEFIVKAATRDDTVLITGESGTGKELTAQLIHRLWGSLRSRRNNVFSGIPPLVPINCGAIPETMVESELFGHEKGAFTGAISPRAGLIEAAHNGTLFLDEIGELSFASQVKLNRFLREGEVRRLGSNNTRLVSVRVIAATNKDLYKEMMGRNFRDDLYYRLNILPIRVPPLRERFEDIPLLVDDFYRKHNSSNRVKIESVHSDVIKMLKEKSWPGNIQQLFNVLARGAANAEPVESRPEGKPVLVKHLTCADFPFLFTESEYSDDVPVSESESQSLADLYLRRFQPVTAQDWQDEQYRYVQGLLKRNDGDKRRTAKLFGMKRTTFIEWLKRRRGMARPE